MTATLTPYIFDPDDIAAARIAEPEGRLPDHVIRVRRWVLYQRAGAPTKMIAAASLPKLHRKLKAAGGWFELEWFRCGEEVDSQVAVYLPYLPTDLEGDKDFRKAIEQHHRFIKAALMQHITHLTIRGGMPESSYENRRQ